MKQRSGVGLKRIDAAGLIVTIMLAVAVGSVTMSSAIAKTSRLHEEQKTLSSHLAYLTQLSQTLGEGEEMLRMLREGMEELDRLLPDELGCEAFYAALAESASAHSIVISELRPGDAVKQDNYTRLPVNIKAKGTFADFHAFLYAVSGMPRLVTVENLVIGVTDQQDLCTIDMTINIYSANRNKNDDARKEISSK